MSIRELKLHWQIAIALALGVLLGFLSRAFNFDAFVIEKVAILGDIFLRGLRMIIVPLIVSSIISGVTSIGSAQNLGRMGAKTFAYYITSSLLAIVIGLIVVNIISPGVKVDVGLLQAPENLAENSKRIGDTLMGIIPQNPLKAMVEGEMLPTIFFSLCFGFFISRTSDPYKTQLTDLFNGIFSVMMKLTQFIIKFTPIGVFALMAKTIAQTGVDVIGPLAAYMSSVVIGLGVHALITLPLLVFVVGKLNPVAHAKAMAPALLTAFSTSSSSATLPLTISCVEENSGVSNKTTSFVLPLGATINMDGTALYECIAAMFIAQAYGLDLSIGQQVVVVFTALLASIGAAGIPMAGLVMISVVLSAIGLPLEGVALILAVDRPLDMLRTAVNVWSDSCGAAIIAKSEGEGGLKILRGSV